MEIKSISQKIFRTASQNTENKNSQTNPFGASFNGNIIKADVFSSSAKSNIAERVSNRSKMVMSTIIGSFGAFNQKISSKLNSVVDFGKRIKAKASDAWRYLNETKISLNLGSSRNLVELQLPETNSSVNNLMKLPVEDLESRFSVLAEARVRGAHE